MKRRNLLISVVCGSILFLATSLFAEGSPVGKWKTIDDETKKAKSYVEIYEKDKVIYAKITKLIGKPDSTLCDKCKKDLHNKRIVGMTFVWGMKKDGDAYEGGRILDPNNGKTYRCKMWVQGNRLKVRGYIAFFYRTQYWYRVK